MNFLYQRLLINFQTSISHLSFILHLKLHYKVIFISTYYMNKLICKLCLKIPPTWCIVRTTNNQTICVNIFRVTYLPHPLYPCDTVGHPRGQRAALHWSVAGAPALPFSDGSYPACYIAHTLGPSSWFLRRLHNPFLLVYIDYWFSSYVLVIIQIKKWKYMFNFLLNQMI